MYQNKILINLMKKLMNNVNLKYHRYIQYAIKKTTNFSDIKKVDLKYVKLEILGDLNKNKDVIIYIHGGGFIVGTPFYSYIQLKKIYENLNIPIVGVDYELAPDKQFPYQICQIIYTIKYFKERGFNNIILLGDSAGGNLILSSINISKLKVKKIILISPHLDLSVEYKNTNDYLKNENIVVSSKLYTNLDLKNKYISPFYFNYNTDISNTDISNIEISNNDISNIEISNIEISNTEISNTNFTNENIKTPILIVYSKKELLAKVINKFINKIKCDSIVINSSNHVYPLIPFTNDKYLNDMCNWIKN